MWSTNQMLLTVAAAEIKKGLKLPMNSNNSRRDDRRHDDRRHGALPRRRSDLQMSPRCLKEKEQFHVI